VRQILAAKGLLLHHLVAIEKESTEWVYTERDLAAIAPPLTAILNRYDVTRAGAAAGDELALAIGFLGYGSRSIRERRGAQQRLAEQPDVPITGEPAEPGSGPEHDEAWLRQTGQLGPDETYDPPPIRRR
jgi:hypothetical protein